MLTYQLNWWKCGIVTVYYYGVYMYFISRFFYRDNLQLLRQRYYYATWKADGTRYMLLLCPDGAYLVDRSFKFRRVQMRFPCKNMTDVCLEKIRRICYFIVVLKRLSLYGFVYYCVGWCCFFLFLCDSQLHQYTLLDGEMIIDTISSERQERRYLIYDLIAINRVSLAEVGYSIVLC